MRNPLAYAGLLLLPLLATACPSDNPEPGQEVPYRSDWITVADNVVFPGVCPPGELGCECNGNDCNAGTCQTLDGEDYCVDGSGAAGSAGQACEGGVGGTCNAGLQCTPEGACVDIPDDTVTSITIGGTDVDDNFINQGDVEVYLTGPSNRITVQMRKFTTASNEATAQTNYDSMELWAYAASVAPPDEVDPETDCSAAWKNGCNVRAYYNGLTQPVRNGADFRVFLPENYTGRINIVTEDVVIDDEYPLRSDVIVKNARGEVDITLDSGTAMVQAADDAKVSALCSTAQIEACENFEIDGEPAPWAATCPCTMAVSGDFSGVKITSRTEQAANMTVDIPSSLWATARMENVGMLTPSSVPLCLAETNCDEFGSCDDQRDFPWKTVTEVNDPGEDAPPQSGYSVQLESGSCGVVRVVDGPDQYEQPYEEERGFMTMCSGCLDIPALEP